MVLAIEGLPVWVNAGTHDLNPCFPKLDRNRGRSTFAHFGIDPIDEAIACQQDRKQHRGDQGARHRKESYN